MIYEVMLYGGFSLAALLFVLSVVLFVKLRIPSVAGDLTGITRRRQIRRIQEEGLRKEPDNFYSQAVGLRRSGTLRPRRGGDAASGSMARRDGRLTGGGTAAEDSGLAAAARDPEAFTAALWEESAFTAVLQEESSTEVLEEERPTELLEKTGSPDGEPPGEAGHGDGTDFEIISETMGIHSEERIG